MYLMKELDVKTPSTTFIIICTKTTNPNKNVFYFSFFFCIKNSRYKQNIFILIPKMGIYIYRVINKSIRPNIRRVKRI